MGSPYRNESGIQNINSTVSGAQAVGAGASASVGVPSSATDALADAVAALVRQLPSLGLDAETREDATAHLEDLRTEDPGRIRRALRGLKGLLGEVAAAAGALTALEHAAEPLIRTLGG